MKILRISLSNLASLAGPHTVDFTREPLKSTGLFSISGPTGSGKSTLLDALCLALYNKTPRLSSAQGENMPDISGDQITQKDPANLLRRGTAEGFAEVVFIGVDGGTYTARWNIRRARLRADGALQSIQMALFTGNVPHPGNPGALASGKITEVLDAIEARIGLSMKQFTRAVLLAQNDFAVFLKSDDKDRALILEALTGTEHFARISKTIFDRDRTERDAVLKIKNLMLGQEPLSPEARLMIEERRVAADMSLHAAREQAETREAHARWFSERREAVARLELAEQALLKTGAEHAAAAPRRAELDLTRHVSQGARGLHEAERLALVEHARCVRQREDATTQKTKAEGLLADIEQALATARAAAEGAQAAREEAAPGLLRARALDTELIPLTARLAELRKDLTAANLAVQAHEREVKQLTENLNTLERDHLRLGTDRARVAHLAPAVTEAPAWIERLGLARTTDRELNRLQGELAIKRGVVTDIDAKLGPARAQLGTAEAALALARTARTETETALRTFDADALAQERRQLDDAHSTLTSLRTHLELTLDLSRQLSLADEALATLENHTERDQTALRATALDQAKAHRALVAAQDARRALEAAAGQSAENLRALLTPEHPCPVCGSTAHPYGQHAPQIDAALEALRKAESDKQAVHDGLRDQLVRLSAALERHAADTKTQTTARIALRKRLDEARPPAPAHAEVIAVLTAPEAERPSLLTRRLAELKATGEALLVREQGQREAAKAHTVTVARFDAAQNTVNAAQTALSNLGIQHAAAVAARDAAAGVLGEAEIARTKAHAAIEPLFTVVPSLAQSTFVANPDAFIAAFTQDTLALRDLDQQIGATEQNQLRLNAAHQAALKALGAAQDAFVKIRDAEIAKAKEHGELTTARAALFGGRGADEIDRELRGAAEKATQARDSADLTFNQAKQAVATATEAARGAEGSWVDAKEKLTTATTALDVWLQEFGTRTGRALDRTRLLTYLVRDETWCGAEQAALDALATALAGAEANRNTRTADLARHDTTRPTPDDEVTVNDDLAKRRSTREEAERLQLAAAAELQADDQRRLANQQLAQACAEREAKAEPWLKLNDLIGSSDGAKFRAIAQRRTLDYLLGYANTQLDQLSARYRLERLPESLNLIVCDRDMGDERRSVHSLSGGESFLVSLALALGLASLTSNRLSIESLFIDEGFGSLDPATLNIAMNALLHLESQGRKVGVISHVSEMADAIPVQIRVVKGRSGASRLVVPGMADPGEGPGTTAVLEAQDEAADVATVAEQIRVMLQQALAEGNPLVSVTRLRKATNCDATVFQAARNALGPELITQGKSLRLAT